MSALFSWKALTVMTIVCVFTTKNPACVVIIVIIATEGEMESSAGEEWMTNGAQPPPSPRHHRSQVFKNSVANVAGSRRRQQAAQVGKERRDALVRGKRLRRGEANENGDADMVMDEDSTAKVLEEKILIAVQELKAAGNSKGMDTSKAKIEALRNVRKLLSSNAAPPLKVAVEAGVVTLLVNCLEFGSPEDQLVEAAWCLTNIASGEQEMTKAVVPAIPMLVLHLGDTSSAAVVEQCAWAIGNVASESEEMRNLLLEQGALLHLGRLMASPAPSLARTTAWAMSNLIKGPSPKAASGLMRLDGMPKFLVELLTKGDDELVVEVVWILVYLTSMSDTHSEVLVNAGLLPPLVNRLVTSDQHLILIPVLRCIGNIVAGDNARTDAVLAASPDGPGGLNGGIRRCLEMGHRTLQKEAALTVSNIAAGTMIHKQIVFQGGTIPSLLHLLATAAFDVRKEAAYALVHVCAAPKRTGKDGVDPIVEHLTVLVDRGCIPGFLALVKSPDTEAARLGLQFLELVMRGLPNNQGPKVVDKEDGIAAMETLQFHENEELYSMANGLIDKYFGEDYGLEEEYGPEAVDVLGGSADSSEYPPWRQQGLAHG
ncbi:unnamed protein product [Calypogeia fissa]